MIALTGLLAGVGVLLWPGRFGRRRLAILPAAPGTMAAVPDSVPWSVGQWARAHQRQLRGIRPRGILPGRRGAGVTPTDLLGLLEAVAPALEAGMAPASALRFAAEARSGADRPDPVALLAAVMASAAADGAKLGPLWQEAAEQADSAELLLLAQAWSLTEDMGAPLAQAVRTTAGLLEERAAHERQLASALAGARATVNLLTVLPLGGPLLALVLGIGPGELYGGSLLTQGSLLLGLCLAGVGRLWVRAMVSAVARGPVLA